MLTLNEKPTLSDLQAYVRDMERERGFEKETALEVCLLLGEEVGELFRAVRKTSGLKCDPNSPKRIIEEEMADVLILLSCLANRYGIDLERAFRDKEEINNRREWHAS